MQFISKRLQETIRLLSNSKDVNCIIYIYLEEADYR